MKRLIASLAAIGLIVAFRAGLWNLGVDGQFILGAVVLVQLIYRLIYGAPSASLMNFGDSLSQFLAQIGRFGSFHSDQKPWPFADWPAPRTPEGEAPHVVAPAPHPVRDEEPKL